MSFLFDNLFQKQDPNIASRMSQHGLVFDKIKHRWVKAPRGEAKPKDNTQIPGMEGPFNYKTGNSYYYSPKEGKYYDRGQDVFMPRGFDPHTGQYSQTVEDKPQYTSYKLGSSSQGKTILRQLGGNKFKSMVGAGDIVEIDDGIQFGIGRSKNGINKVRITFEGGDTYNMEFFRIRQGKATPIHEASNIYAEDLAKVFEDTTGLYTKL